MKFPRLNLKRWIIYRLGGRTAQDFDFILCQLRYRIEDGKLSFIYRLHQPQCYWDDAVKDAIVRVGKETELPVALGSYQRK